MLQGRRIDVRDGVCVDENGTLAGSAIDMATAVRNTVELLGVPLAQAAGMASTYPAQFLGLGSELGRIAPGYRANLVAGRTAVVETWIDGVGNAKDADRPMPYHCRREDRDSCPHSRSAK